MKADDFRVSGKGKGKSVAVEVVVTLTETVWVSLQETTKISNF